jgi:hypothetical protein
MATPAKELQFTTATRPLEYNQLPWGDLIYGTKEQLASLGIAVAGAFPGEPGSSRRCLTVTDPRGFKCRIEACDYREEGVFCASIPLPGRDVPEPTFEYFSPGVLKQENIWTDDYVGTADALAAAGLIRLDQLPGRPGMRKVVVTILPDGSLPQGAANAKCPQATEPGARQIRRASTTSYRVSVYVEADEKSRRYDAYARSRYDWEEQMRRVPRPAPLHARLLTFASGQTASTPAKPTRRTVGNVIYLSRA